MIQNFRVSDTTRSSEKRGRNRDREAHSCNYGQWAHFSFIHSFKKISLELKFVSSFTQSFKQENRIPKILADSRNTKITKMSQVTPPVRSYPNCPKLTQLSEVTPAGGTSNYIILLYFLQVKTNNRDQPKQNVVIKDCGALEIEKPYFIKKYMEK